jgi:hypothetical protein
LDLHGLLSSHVWEPTEHLSAGLADRAGDVLVGAQDKRWGRALALVKLPRQRSGEPLPPSVLAHERLASEIGIGLGLSVNEVFLCRLTSPSWAELQGSWASLHCLVPEPFQRLDEMQEGVRNDLWSGADRTTLANDAEFRAVKIFDHLILNGDRHGGNILVSGGRQGGSLWAYFIDHGYAFGGPTAEAQLAEETVGDKLTPYVRERSTLKQWWHGIPDEERLELLPFARRVAGLRGTDLERMIAELPNEVSSAPTKRFLKGCLEYQVNILREEVDEKG